jgi:hypothetical protein
MCDRSKHYNLDGVPVRLEIIDSGQNRAFAYPGIDIVIVLFAIDSHEFSVLDEVTCHTPPPPPPHTHTYTRSRAWFIVVCSRSLIWSDGL